MYQPNTLPLVNRILELLIDLLSTAPTRKYALALVKDHYILESSRDALGWIKGHTVFQGLVERLEYYIHIVRVGEDGEELNDVKAYHESYAKLTSLQKTWFGLDGCVELALVNVGRLKGELVKEVLGKVKNNIFLECMKVAGLRIVNVGEGGVKVEKPGQDLEKYSNQFLTAVLADRVQALVDSLKQRQDLRGSLYPTEVLPLFSYFNFIMI
jgi:hypothetical protein